MVKSICNVTEFTKSMLYNYIKVVRLNLTNLTSGYRPVRECIKFTRSSMTGCFVPLHRNKIGRARSQAFSAHLCFH